MGKLALLLVAVGAVVLMQRRHLDHDVSARATATLSTGETLEVLARSNALAGFARLEQALSTSFTDADVTGAFEGGTYTAEAVVVDDQARVTTVGTYPRPGGDPETFRIRALIEPGAASDPTSLAPVLKYGVFAGGSLSLGGSADIMQDTPSSGSGQALVHTNQDLRVNGGGSRVRGFGTFAGTVSGPYQTAFAPPSNPGGLPPVQTAPAVPLPLLDLDAIAGAYDTVLHHHPTGVSAALIARGVTLPGGTRDSPIVYRVHGDMSVRDITVDGYAVFLVDGNVSVTGSLASGVPWGGATESAVGIFTTGNLQISGNSSVSAHIVAAGSYSANGATSIYGGLATYGDLSLGGNTQIMSRPASPSLATPWIGGAVGLVILAYAEH